MRKQRPTTRPAQSPVLTLHSPRRGTRVPGVVAALLALTIPLVLHPALAQEAVLREKGEMVADFLKGKGFTIGKTESYSASMAIEASKKAFGMNSGFELDCRVELGPLELQRPKAE